MNGVVTRKLWDGRWRGTIQRPRGIVRFWYERKERAARPAALLGWYTGDDGRALYSPAGALVCYHDDARRLCTRLNAARLARLRQQRGAAGD